MYPRWLVHRKVEAFDDPALQQAQVKSARLILARDFRRQQKRNLKANSWRKFIPLRWKTGSDDEWAWPLPDDVWTSPSAHQFTTRQPQHFLTEREHVYALQHPRVLPDGQVVDLLDPVDPLLIGNPIPSATPKGKPRSLVRRIVSAARDGLACVCGPRPPHVESVGICRSILQEGTIFC